MRPAKALTGLLLAILLGAGVHWLAREFAPPPLAQLAPASAAAAVQRLLALELPDQRGDVQKLAQWRGKPLLINFWATWCAPCREEMPLLDKVAREQNGVQVLGIALDSVGNVADYVRQHPAAYPLLMANGAVHELFVALGNPAQGLPFSLLVAADGEALSVRLGAFSPAELRDLLANHSVANGSKMR